MALTSPSNTKNTRSTIKSRNVSQTSEVKKAKNVLMKLTSKAIKTTQKLRMALTSPSNTKITRSTIRNTNLLTLKAQKAALVAENVLVNLIESKPIEQAKTITEK